MQFAEFKAQLEAARRVEHSVDGAKFQLTVPTEYRSRVAFEEHRDPLGRVEFTKAFRSLVTQSITGWSGVTQRHFTPDGSGDPVVFSTDARDAFFDIRQDICDELGQFVSAQVKERREALEAKAKNS